MSISRVRWNAPQRIASSTMCEVIPEPNAAAPNASTGVYLYCFARRMVAGRIAASGIEPDAPVTCLVIGELAAVFSAVSVESFTGPRGDANLRDAAWIVPRAQRHEQVVEQVMRLSPVLPARFGTVLSSRATLERLLTRHAEATQRFLVQMADREEWSVKAFLDVRQAEAWLLAAQAALDSAPDADAGSPGLRYLQRKRLLGQARQRRERWRRQTADDLERALVAHAVDVRPLQLHARAASAGDGEMILNDAMLVLKTRLSEWRACAEAVQAQHAERGLRLSISGPWPPYSFCPAIFDVEPDA
jgi:hypothetical protein